MNHKPKDRMFLSRPWSFRLTDSQKNKKGYVSHDKGIRVGHRTQPLVLFHKVDDILYGTSSNASQSQDGGILIGLTDRQSLSCSCAEKCEICD